MAFSLAVNSLRFVSQRPMTVAPRLPALRALMLLLAAPLFGAPAAKVGYNESIQPILAEIGRAHV